MFYVLCLPSFVNVYLRRIAKYKYFLVGNTILSEIEARKYMLDYIVRMGPEGFDSPEVFVQAIYQMIVKRRIKMRKPTIIFLDGESASGKSFTALKLQDIILGLQGIDALEYVKDINVTQDEDFPEKYDKFLFNKDLKKVNVFCIHEASKAAGAKDWFEIRTRAIASAHRMARSQKVFVMIIISQGLDTVAREIRKQITYYVSCDLSGEPNNKKVSLRWYRIYLDSRDIETIRLKKRRIKGFVIDENNRYRLTIPQYINISLPREELVKEFEEYDRGGKIAMLKKDINDMKEHFLKINPTKLLEKHEKIAEYYVKHPAELSEIGKYFNGKWRPKEDFRRLHGLDKKEVKLLVGVINEKLQATNLIQASSE